MKDLEDGVWKSRIAEEGGWRPPLARRCRGASGGLNTGHGCARGGQGGVPARAELVERGFTLVLDRGGKAGRRGRDNLRKRYLIHVAGYNPAGRAPWSGGNPAEFVAGTSARLLLLATAEGDALVVLTVVTGSEAAMLVISFQPKPAY